MRDILWIIKRQWLAMMVIGAGFHILGGIGFKISLGVGLVVLGFGMVIGKELDS